MVSTVLLFILIFPAGTRYLRPRHRYAYTYTYSICICRWYLWVFDFPIFVPTPFRNTQNELQSKCRFPGFYKHHPHPQSLLPVCIGRGCCKSQHKHNRAQQKVENLKMENSECHVAVLNTIYYNFLPAARRRLCVAPSRLKLLFAIITLPCWIYLFYNLY